MKTTITKDEIIAWADTCRNGSGPVDLYLFATLCRADLVAEIERLRDQIHTCGPTCSKAGCVNQRLRAEVERLKKQVQQGEHDNDHEFWIGVCEGLDEQKRRDAAFEAVRKQFVKLPRYSFLLDDLGNVRRVPMKTGHWVEFIAAHELFDPVCVDAALRAKPLTDDQIYEMYNEPRSDAEMLEFARAIEAAHGIGEQP